MPLTPVLHSIYKGWLRQAARKAALSPIVATPSTLSWLSVSPGTSLGVTWENILSEKCKIMLDALMIVLYQPPSQGRPQGGPHMHMLSVHQRYTVTTCTKARPQTNPPSLPQTLQPLHQRAQAPARSSASEDVQDSTVIIDGV